MALSRTYLSDLAIGSVAEVVEVADGARGEGKRLREVGFVPGTTVMVERRAPLGDPTVYLVRSTRLALRREGAALIEVLDRSEARAQDSGDGARQ